MISIVLPVFNESENIPRLYQRLSSAAQRWGERYEVIVVDDGSTDSSAADLAAIHRQDPRWKVLSFSRNFGHQAAISAGIHYSQGDATVVMDADLQDPPEELCRFLEKWREGFQVVYAIRTKRKEGLLKRFAYAAFYRVLRFIASIDIPLDSGDFCVMDRCVVDVLRSMPEKSRFVRGLRSWSGFKQIGVAYERHSRNAGEVKYTFSKLIKLALDGVFSFSSLPLKISSGLGIVLCGLSIVLSLGVAGWWASGIRIFSMTPRDAVGWTSLCCLLLMLSGLQFLVMGFVGEYLSRVFEEVKGRPPWIIANAVGFEFSTAAAKIGWFVPNAPAADLAYATPYSKAG